MRRPDDRTGGYALVLAMLALTALTLLGLAALSIADVDLTITHNIRRYHQAFNAANAGLDHAREVNHGIASNPMQTATLNAAAAAGECTTIVGPGTISPTAMETGGWPTALYTVDRCYAECGGIPLGYEMTQGINHGGGGGQMRNVYLDIQSTATDEDANRTRSAATAITAGFLKTLGYCQ